MIMKEKGLFIWFLTIIYCSQLTGQESLAQQAKSLMDKEKYEEAIPVFKKLRNNYLFKKDFSNYLITSSTISDNLDIIGESDKAINLIKESIDKSNGIKDIDSLRGILFHELANIQYSLKDDYSAIKNWQYALQIRNSIFNPNHIDIIKLYRNLGNAYFNVGQIERGRVCLQKSVDIHLSRTELNQSILSKTYNDLGKIYLTLEDYSKAKKYLDVALDSYKKLYIEEPWMMNFVYENVIDYHRRLENFPEMLNKQIEILNINKELEDKWEEDYIKIANSYNNLGMSYELLDSFSKAESKILESIQINKKFVTKNKEALAINYNNLASIYAEQKKIEKALMAINTAIAYDKESEIFLGLAENIEEKSRIYLLKGNGEQALYSIEEAIKITYTNNSVNGLILDKPLLVSLLDSKLKTLNFLGKTDINYSKKSPEIIDEISKLIHQIRNEYQSDDSKSFLAKKVKDIFESSIQTYLQLHLHTEDHTYKFKAFKIAEQSKSIILMNAIQEAITKKTLPIPSHLLERETNLKKRIAQKEKAIFLEDKEVNTLNNELIVLHRTLEKLRDTLAKQFPKYYQAKYATKILTLKTVKSKLKGSLIEYFVGDSTIYAFAITNQSPAIEIIEILTRFSLKKMGEKPKNRPIQYLCRKIQRR